MKKLSLNINRQSIISSLYEDKDIKEAISKMQPAELQSDLKQEIFLVVCELDEEKLIQMHVAGFLKFYIFRTMLNMIKSNRSAFYNKYRKNEKKIEYLIQNNLSNLDDLFDESVYEIIKELMNGLHWYDRTVFSEVYIGGKMVVELANETQIPYRSLIKTVAKVKKMMYQNIKSKLKQNAAS